MVICHWCRRAGPTAKFCRVKSQVAKTGAGSTTEVEVHTHMAGSDFL